MEYIISSKVSSSPKRLFTRVTIDKTFKRNIYNLTLKTLYYKI